MDRPNLRGIYDATGGDLAQTADRYEAAVKGDERIVDTARLVILRGGSDLEALEAVLRRHPSATTKLNQISQYRTYVRQAGIPVETQRDIGKRRRAEAIAGARDGS